MFFVLFCFVLFYFILFYFILFYFILFYFILFHFILFHFISFHFILFYFIFFILFYFILFYFILFYFILFYFILFYFILFYFILFYFILFYFISFHFILFYFILFYLVLLYFILFYFISFPSILFDSIYSISSIRFHHDHSLFPLSLPLLLLTNIHQDDDDIELKLIRTYGGIVGVVLGPNWRILLDFLLVLSLSFSSLPFLSPFSPLSPFSLTLSPFFPSPLPQRFFLNVDFVLDILFLLHKLHVNYWDLRILIYN